MDSLKIGPPKPPLETDPLKPKSYEGARESEISVTSEKRSRYRANRAGPVSPSSGIPVEFDEKVRSLVREVMGHESIATLEVPMNDAHEPVVLFDLEVDGRRYRLVSSARKPSSVMQSASPFSPRESEIAQMIAKGYPNKTIAAVLDISIWTVNTYLRRMFAKLNVGSRAAMVAKLLGDSREDRVH